MTTEEMWQILVAITQSQIFQRCLRQDESLYTIVALTKSKDSDLSNGFQIRFTEQDDLIFWLEEYQRRLRVTFEGKAHSLKSGFEKVVDYIEANPNVRLIRALFFCKEHIYWVWADVNDPTSANVIAMAKTLAPHM